MGLGAMGISFGSFSGVGLGGEALLGKYRKGPGFCSEFLLRQKIDHE